MVGLVRGDFSEGHVLLNSIEKIAAFTLGERGGENTGNGQRVQVKISQGSQRQYCS